MALATVTSKGQVTIPSEVRIKLGLQAGDRLDFRVNDDGSIAVTPVGRKVADVFGILSGHSQATAVDVEEMDRRLIDGFRRDRS